MENRFDILIIGAGASGLAAAIKAKSEAPWLRVGILERLPRVGKKILATGNGRCNLTNLNAHEHRYTNSDFAANVFAQYSEQVVIDFFKSIGLLTYSDSCGRVYPMSNTASSVLDCLRFEAKRLEIEIICEEKCEKIEKIKRDFVIDGKHSARMVIMAAGGCASPSQGTDGSGFELMRSLGHSVGELYPSLVQLTSPDKLLRSLKGVRVHDAVISAAGRVSRGELLFTDYGLSGIAAMEISADVAKKARGSNVIAQIDLLPSMNEGETEEFLSSLSGACENALVGILPRAVGMAVLKRANISPETDIKALSRNRIGELVERIKSFTLTLSGAKGFENAQVTRGGVRVNEFDSETLESNIVENLFCSGEILDVDGGCGGFNLQWAWASGLCAGESAARKSRLR